LAGASTKIEMDADYDKDGYATTKAILLSKAMRKITNLIAKEKICLVFTNQLRTKMNAMAFADPWCVNPYTTKIKIRKMNYIEEEITLAELAERFLNLNDFNTENAYDMSDLNIEVLSKNLKSGKDEYKKINTFLVKETVPFYYSDDKLEGTAKHRIIENGKEVFLENHSDFKKIENEMKVVDIEVEDNENYYANDRLNHNTTSGGKAVAFHSSVRVRLNNAGALKKKDFGGVDQIVGNKLQAKVIKNRLGPPQRKASFEIFYDSGIDNYSGWVAVLKTYKFLAQGGAYNKYKLYDTNGNELEEIQFKTAEIPELFSKRPEIQQAMYKNLCDIMIMKYENNGQIKMNDDIQIANDEDGGIE
jgi:RecA/RadA recombinase